MKKSIHFNNQDLRDIDELSRMLGFGPIKGGWGRLPKVLRFGVTFTIQSLKKLNKVIPDLKPAEMDFLFESIKIIRKEQENQKVIKELEKAAGK